MRRPLLPVRKRRRAAVAAAEAVVTIHSLKGCCRHFQNRERFGPLKVAQRGCRLPRRTSLSSTRAKARSTCRYTQRQRRRHEIRATEMICGPWGQGWCRSPDFHLCGSGSNPQLVQRSPPSGQGRVGRSRKGAVFDLTRRRSLLFPSIRNSRVGLSASLFDVGNPQCVAVQEADPCPLQSSSHCR